MLQGEWEMEKFEACIRLRQLLVEEKPRKLLDKLLSSGKIRIKPVFTPGVGFRYREAEEATGLGPEEAEKLLDELHQLGIMKKILHDKTVICPDCGSPEVSVHFNCPSCRSMNTSKLSLIEDMACGYIDKEDQFKADGKMVCPHCGRQLLRPGVDFRRVGIWYVCDDCGHEFDVPLITFTCRSCGRQFTTEEARYEPVFSYELDESVRDVALITKSILGSLTGLLRSRGFVVESPGIVNGRSGEKHMFDLIAKGGSGRTMAVEVYISDNPLPERVVTTTFAKFYDTTFSDAFLIAIPRMRDEGRRLATLYRIHLIEGVNRDQILRAFRAAAGLS